MMILFNDIRPLMCNESHTYRVFTLTQLFVVFFKRYDHFQSKHVAFEGNYKVLC